ncbi:MAG: RRXRR domain-containing protein, partial [Moorella sp. (in: Bacteria)]|nr:RRXRR domain-containing protein [Moorella sp. (in: firmicutes)]
EIASEYNANQYFILANDPGSKYDGFALACKYVQLRLMAVMPGDVHDKMDARRNLRRARRYRNARRRPWRDRSPGPDWIAPSQLAKVLFRLAIVKELCKLFPVRYFIVEDVKFDHYNKRYGKHFSTVEIGKSLYYTELRGLGTLLLVRGWQTRLWREEAGLMKTSQKDALTPASHANDAVAMLTGLAGCEPNEKAP